MSLATKRQELRLHKIVSSISTSLILSRLPLPESRGHSTHYPDYSQLDCCYGQGTPPPLNRADVGSVEYPETVLTSKSQMVSSDAESSSGIDILDKHCRKCGIRI